jgi:DNA-3-methyladenine glycosylase
MAEVFSKRFYRQDTELVAKRLLGQRLVHIVGGKRLSGIIVETEAYLGGIDKAAHTFEFRRTQRVKSMWLHGGHAYVFLIYGMYYCFNVVTRTDEHPEAVLIRALQPDENVKIQINRRHAKRIEDIASGPGKLCSALAIDKKCDGLSLLQPPLFIERARSRFLKDEDIVSSPRIGVDYAGAAAAWPLRFSIRGNVFVSKPHPDLLRKKQRSLI